MNRLFLYRRGQRLMSSRLRRFSNKQRQDDASNVWSWYNRQLEERPLLTKGITSGLLSILGDLICQGLEGGEQEHHHSWDGYRTSRLGVLGTLYVAPLTHAWYHTLSTTLLPPTATASRVLPRVVVDQFAFAPLFVTGFCSLLWTLEGRRLSDLPHELQTHLPDIVVANWTLWIPAMALNFRFVPLKFQVLYSNVVALVWNVYLSYKSARTLKEYQQAKGVQGENQS